MKLKNWELVGWNYNNDGCNRNISLTEEQALTVFNVLGIKICDIPNDKYNFELTMYTDEYLKIKREEINE